MLFSTDQMARIHQLKDRDVSLRSKDHQIDRVHQFKVLGVEFQENLKWDAHINKTIRACMATLRSLKQFKRSASRDLKKSLVQSLVMSKIDYCNEVFANATKISVQRLQKVERAAASVVLNRYCKEKDVLTLGWLPVKERISLALVKLAHKALYQAENWPSYLELKFKPARARPLRGEEERRSEVDVGADDGTFQSEAGRQFNRLPESIRKEDDFDRFARAASNFLFDCATARVLEEET